MYTTRNAQGHICCSSHDPRNLCSTCRRVALTDAYVASTPPALAADIARQAAVPEPPPFFGLRPVNVRTLEPAPRLTATTNGVTEPPSFFDAVRRGGKETC